MARIEHTLYTDDIKQVIMDAVRNLYTDSSILITNITLRAGENDEGEQVITAHVVLDDDDQ